MDYELGVRLDALLGLIQENGEKIDSLIEAVKEVEEEGAEQGKPEKKKD